MRIGKASLQGNARASSARALRRPRAQPDMSARFCKHKYYDRAARKPTEVDKFVPNESQLSKTIQVGASELMKSSSRFSKIAAGGRKYGAECSLQQHRQRTLVNELEQPWENQLQKSLYCTK